MNYTDVAVHGISGAISGIVAICVWYPLETVRIRIQVKDLTKKAENDERVFYLPEEDEKTINKIKKIFRNKVEILKFVGDIMKIEGVLGLYNGMSSAILGTVASSGSYFLAYKFFKDFFNYESFNKQLALKSMITSLLGAFVSATLSNPVWVLNNRMTRSKKEIGNVSNFEMIKTIIKQEGIGGFFKGLGPSLILCTNPMIQYGVYEVLREKLLDSEGNISGKQVILISLFSKLITTLITYPILTIKTLFQDNKDKTTKELKQLILNVLKDKGLLALYKGI